MGKLLMLACRTLDAYTVEGAWDRGWSHTDRRSFGPGARTEMHAGRRESLSPPPQGAAYRAWVEVEEHSFPAAALPSPRLGEGGGGERMLWREAEKRWGSGMRPAAGMVRAAKKNA